MRGDVESGLCGTEKLPLLTESKSPSRLIASVETAINRDIPVEFTADECFKRICGGEIEFP